MMRSFLTIATNAYMELVRQPFFLVLSASSVAFIVFLGSVYYYALGEDVRLVKDSVLAVVFLSGLFGAVFSASSSVSRELASGTALAVLSKPVARLYFILAKFVGLAAALTVLTYVNLLGALVASRIAFDAYGEPDLLAIGIMYSGLLGAFLVGAGVNYFLKRPFVGVTMGALVVFLTLAFVAMNMIDEEGHWQAFGADIDWRMIPACILLLFALWILAAVAVACTTRLEMVPTLAICSIVFLLGLMSDYLFGRSDSFLATIPHSILPNLQVFWMADVLMTEKGIPFSYMARAFGYLLGYLVMALSLALYLFEDRELS